MRQECRPFTIRHWRSHWRRQRFGRLRKDALLQLADRADAEATQQYIRGNQGAAAARQGSTWLFANQALLQEHLDLAVTIGQTSGGDLGTRDRLLEDDDRQDEPHGLGQLEWLEQLAASEVRQQAFHSAAGRAARDQAQPIAVDLDLQAARRLSDKRVGRDLQARRRPVSYLEEVGATYRIADGEQQRRQRVGVHGR